MNERDELEALFREAHAHVPEQPFVNATLRSVAAAQRRAALVRRALTVGGVALIAIAAPWLIRGAELLSHALDSGFARVGEWLATPWGIAGVAAGVAIVLAARRYFQFRS